RKNGFSFNHLVFKKATRELRVAEFDLTPALSFACPSPVSRNSSTGKCGANVTFGNATAPSGFQTSFCPPSGSFFEVGSHTVTCTFTHGGGPVRTCDFNVTVTDNEDPTICCSDIVTKSLPGKAYGKIPPEPGH